MHTDTLSGRVEESIAFSNFAKHAMNYDYSCYKEHSFSSREVWIEY